VKKISIWALVLCLLCIGASGLTNTAGADEHEQTFVVEGEDISVQGDFGAEVYRAHVSLNRTDRLYTNWTAGSQMSGSQQFRIYVHTLFAVPKWSNFTEETDTSTTLTLYKYIFYATINDCAPMIVWLEAPVSATYLIVIRSWAQTNTQTVNITVDRSAPGNEISAINKRISDLEGAIDGMNSTLSDRISQLNDTDNDMLSNISEISDRIDALAKNIQDNTDNITDIHELLDEIAIELEDIRGDLEDINTTVIANITNINLADLSQVNKTLGNLSTALDDLEARVDGFNVPPDLSSEIDGLKAENSALKDGIEDLQAQVDGIEPGENRTFYVNETNNNTYQTVEQEALNDASQKTLYAAMGLGIVSCLVAGVALGRGRKKEEPPEELPVAKVVAEQVYPDSEPETFVAKEEAEAKIEDTDGVEDDELEDALNELLNTKDPLADKSAETEVDDVPIVAVSKTEKKETKRRTINIGRREYNVTQLLSRLSSLPRGLPSEFFGMDLSEVADELMEQEYLENEEGDIVFKYEKKWYYGDPYRVATYMQKAQPPKK